MARPLRVLVDGTPLLGARSGVGRYAAGLLAELAAMPGLDLAVVGFTARGQRALRAAVPPGVAVRGLPVPARALRAAWRRVPAPPVELLAGGADVVHGTNFVLPPAARARGVLTVHDLAFLDQPGELDPAQRGLPGLVRRSAQRAAVVCAPTTAVASRIIERLGVPPERVVVTPLGVDPAWFDAAPGGALNLPERYLLFVGTPQPRKGLDVLLAAHARDTRLPPLVLAGPAGWGFQAAVDGSRVRRLGYLPDGELRAVVAGAAALVLPSRDEGFGLPVLEALAAGVPVVCSDVPALREVAGRHASYVPVGDVDSLAGALGGVTGAADDPGAAAARRARAAAFTWRACAEATLTAYRRASSSPADSRCR